MRKIRLLDLDLVPAVRSQSVYHAVAYAQQEESPDTIILVSPADPYVCIGFHQELEKEVDLAFCERHRLPVYRREVGGGAVYLDAGQIFTQWIFRPHRLPPDLESRFKLFVQPIVDTYQSYGVKAYYRPINDIHVDGKKIGGTGAALIGSADVVVGSLMLAFDKNTMAKVLKVSSEKMRDKVYESLQQYMTTLGEQMGHIPDRAAIRDRYIESCSRVLEAELVPGALTEDEQDKAEELDRRLASDEWLHQKGALRQVGVKIHEDVRVVEAAFKAPGGLIRVTARVRDRHIEDVEFSGDFTLLPAFSLSALERELRGVLARREEVVMRAEEVYRGLRIASPGIVPADFGEVIGLALKT